eukprot:g17375.t1
MGASGSQFNKETFEAELRTAIKRCERMIQKAEARAPFARQECQKYLGAGKEDLARMQAQSIIARRNQSQALSTIAQGCTMLLSVTPQLARAATLPTELAPTIATLRFCSQHVEVPELHQALRSLALKFPEAQSQPSTSPNAANAAIVQALTALPSPQSVHQELQAILSSWAPHVSTGTEPPMPSKYVQRPNLFTLGVAPPFDIQQEGPSPAYPSGPPHLPPPTTAFPSPPTGASFPPPGSATSSNYPSQELGVGGGGGVGATFGQNNNKNNENNTNNSGSNPRQQAFADVNAFPPAPARPFLPNSSSNPSLSSSHPSSSSSSFLPNSSSKPSLASFLPNSSPSTPSLSSSHLYSSSSSSSSTTTTTTTTSGPSVPTYFNFPYQGYNSNQNQQTQTQTQPQPASLQTPTLPLHRQLGDQPPRPDFYQPQQQSQQALSQQASRSGISAMPPLWGTAFSASPRQPGSHSGSPAISQNPSPHTNERKFVYPAQGGGASAPGQHNLPGSSGPTHPLHNVPRDDGSRPQSRHSSAPPSPSISRPGGVGYSQQPAQLSTQLPYRSRTTSFLPDHTQTGPPGQFANNNNSPAFPGIGGAPFANGHENGPAGFATGRQEKASSLPAMGQNGPFSAAATRSRQYTFPSFSSQETSPFSSQQTSPSSLHDSLRQLGQAHIQQANNNPNLHNGSSKPPPPSSSPSPRQSPSQNNAALVDQYFQNDVSPARSEHGGSSSLSGVVSLSEDRSFPSSPFTSPFPSPTRPTRTPLGTMANVARSASDDGLPWHDGSKYASQAIAQRSGSGSEHNFNVMAGNWPHGPQQQQMRGQEHGNFADLRTPPTNWQALPSNEPLRQRKPQPEPKGQPPPAFGNSSFGSANDAVDHQNQANGATSGSASPAKAGAGAAVSGGEEDKYEKKARQERARVRISRCCCRCWFKLVCVFACFFALLVGGFALRAAWRSHGLAIGGGHVADGDLGLTMGDDHVADGDAATVDVDRPDYEISWQGALKQGWQDTQDMYSSHVAPYATQLHETTVHKAWQQLEVRYAPGLDYVTRTWHDGVDGASRSWQVLNSTIGPLARGTIAFAGKFYQAKVLPACELLTPLLGRGWEWVRQAWHTRDTAAPPQDGAEMDRTDFSSLSEQYSTQLQDKWSEVSSWLKGVAPWAGQNVRETLKQTEKKLQEQFGQGHAQEL